MHPKLHRVEGSSLVLNQMSRNLLQIRRHALPKSPTTSAEITAVYEDKFVQDNYGLTLRNEGKRTNFFKHAFECADFSYCIFASDDVIDAALSNVDVGDRKIYMDGTFRVCPMGKFQQLLIIYVNIFGQVSEQFIIVQEFLTDFFL